MRVWEAAMQKPKAASSKKVAPDRARKVQAIPREYAGNWVAGRPTAARSSPWPTASGLASKRRSVRASGLIKSPLIVSRHRASD